MGAPIACFYCVVAERKFPLLRPGKKYYVKFWTLTHFPVSLLSINIKIKVANIQIFASYILKLSFT